jgi:hypothetical protein
MVGDIAFVPIEVLLVTLIIHRLLHEREKHARLEKGRGLRIHRPQGIDLP